MRLLIALLAAIGGLILAAGIVYFTVPAHALPSFLGPLRSKGHRVHRGDFATAVGAALFVIALVLSVVPIRPRRPLP
jgi:hypothetical protein